MEEKEEIVDSITENISQEKEQDEKGTISPFSMSNALTPETSDNLTKVVVSCSSSLLKSNP